MDETPRLLHGALTPAELKRLSELSTPRAAVSIAKTATVTAGLFAVGLLAPHPAVWVAVGCGLAAQQHALAILAHDATHHRLFGDRRLNELAGRLCGYAVGLSLVAYRRQHHAHHHHLYTERDPDMALMAGYPRGRAYLARKLAQDLCGLTTLKNLRYLYGPLGRKAHAGEQPAADARAELRWDQARAVAFHLGLLGLAAATGQWLAYGLWMVPLLTVYQVLLRVRALYEHAAPADTSTPFKAARTNLTGPIGRFFLFPHRVHYHIEHHVFPSIPHYHLPEAHRLMQAAGALDDAEVCRGLGEGWNKFYAAAPVQGIL